MRRPDYPAEDKSQRRGERRGVAEIMGRHSANSLLVTILGGLVLVSTAFGQAPDLPTLRTPRPSQGAQVTQAIGLSTVTITYSRPGVKGREIWGPKGSKALLPYGEVWRAGANDPTTLTFSDDVTVNGGKLRAGSYRFCVIPNEGAWTVIFNTETGGNGAVYHEQYDTLRFTVTPTTGPNEEWLSYSFTDLTPSSATVVLAWERMRLSFKIEFDLLAKLQSSVGTWNLLNNAARFALDNKMYLAEAMTWVDRSIAIDKNLSNMRTKAELTVLSGSKSSAVALAEEALALVKGKDSKTLSAGQQQQVTALKQLIDEWKK